MGHFEDVNRTALVVSPKKLFFDWLKTVDPTMPTQDEKHDSKTIYLLPEDGDNGKWERYLKKHYHKIFEEELETWVTNPTLWPKDLSWQMFTEWLDYEFHSVILDTVSGSIEKE